MKVELSNAMLGLWSNTRPFLKQEMRKLTTRLLLPASKIVLRSWHTFSDICKKKLWTVLVKFYLTYANEANLNYRHNYL